MKQNPYANNVAKHFQKPQISTRIWQKYTEGLGGYAQFVKTSR